MLRHAVLLLRSAMFRSAICVAMQCFVVVQCFAMQCCFAVQCFAVLRNAVLCFAMLRNTVLRSAMLRNAMQRRCLGTPEFHNAVKALWP